MKTLVHNFKLSTALLLLLGTILGGNVFGQTTIFQYNFTSGNTPSTDNAVGTPSISTIGTIGGTLTNGCTTNGYSGDSWDAGDAIRFIVNTTGFVGLTFSYNERASNAAINNFLVRVSTDGTNWTEVLASYVPPTACTGSGNITIPEVFSDVANLFIEIYKVNAAGNATRSYRIDDATLTGFVKTNFYSKSTGNLNTLSNWGTNTDGTGTAPANFTTAGQIFNVRNNATPTIGAAWTVSGIGSEVIVGNGTNACNFTVPSGFAFTGNIDVSANATLTLTNTSIPTLGVLNATSTVVYNATTAQTISAVTYGNLTVSGARGTNDVTFAGATNITGDLTVSATGSAGGQLIFNSSGSLRTFAIGKDYIQSGYEAEFGSGSATSTINLTGNFSKTGGYIVTTTAANATFNFVGTTQNLQSNGGTIIKWINFNIASGSTCTLNGAFNLDGSAGNLGLFTVSSGATLNSGTNIILGTTNTTFTLASGGTLGIGSSAGITTAGTATGNIQTNVRTFNTGGNYVYNGGGAQAAGNALPATIGSLTINNNTVLTLPTVKGITNNFSITTGSSANLGTGLSHTAGTLTRGGFGSPSGSHGSTTSAATNKNNTFFAATTGIVTVGTGTCAAISATISGTSTICNGGSANFSVTITGGVGPYTVVYSGSPSGGATVNSYTSGNTISVSPTVNTTYTLTSVTDAFGCTAGTLTGSSVITVNTLSTAPTGATGTTTICNGGSTTLTVAGGSAGTGAIVEWFTASCGGTSAGTGNSITVSPTTTTTYYVRYNGTCNTTTCGTVTVTVNTLSTAPTGATGTTTICNGGSTTLTVAGGSAGTGATAEWFTASCGGTSAGTGNSITVSPTTTTTYYVRYNGTCNTTTCGTVTVTVNTISTAPTGATGTTTICVGASTTLTVAGGSAGTGAITEWFTGSCGGTSAGTGNTISVSPTSTTTYYVRYNGTCNTTTCGTVTVTVLTANTWTGGASSTSWTTAGNWSCGVPVAATDVTISTASFYPEITSNVTINSLTMDSGTTLKVITSNSLTVTDLIINDGTLTIENNANLLQTNNVTNTGSGLTLVRRNSSALLRQDYTLWSSPVSGQQLQSFSPVTLATRFFTYNPTLGTNGQYVVVASPSTTNFSTGKGYLIRMPNNHPVTPATIWNGQFAGTPNNGNIPLTMTYGGAGFRFVAVGNPYPSPIDAVDFVNETTNAANTTGTLYFWRKTNNAASPSYCSWTDGGGFVSNGEAQVYDPNDVIQTGQGFFVEATGAGTALNFDNTMRTDDHANQFFRPAAPIERHRVWLNATNTAGAFSQMLVGYIAGATNGIDPRIDGRYINDGAIALNSLINTVPYTIQGKSLPFNAADIVPLSFSATTAGTYTIAIDHADGIFSNPNRSVYLKDNLNNVRHNLQQSAYTFTASAGTTDSRFEIVFQDVYFQDLDGDGFGNPLVTLTSDTQPVGYVSDNTDCDDTVAAINPGHLEVLYNGVDDNCDGNIDEGFQVTTTLQGCGTTLNTIGSLIAAVSLGAPITGYRFEVTRVGSLPLEVQVVNGTGPNFSLTQLPLYAYATTYSVRVMLQRNGIWLGYYGPACNISSPAVLAPGGATAVTPSQCGITLPTISTLIATTSLAGATGYKFRVTNQRTGYTQELTRTLHWFALTMLTQYNYGDTYTVEVAVKTTGDFSGYGSPCNVTAPVVPSLTSQCGATIPTKNTNIVTASLNLVTSYDFEVRNETTLATANVSNNLNWFRLSMLPNYTPNTQFRVRVRVLSSGIYSDYGDACFITSPAFARTVETVVDSNVFEVTASPNPFDTNFGMFLNATSTEDVTIRVYDMIGKLIEQREVKATEVVTQEVGNNYPSGVYNVIVSQGTEIKTLRVIKR